MPALCFSSRSPVAPKPNKCDNRGVLNDKAQVRGDLFLRDLVRQIGFTRDKKISLGCFN